MKKLFQLKSVNGFSQRIPFFSTNQSRLFLNNEPMKKMEVYFSTFSYILNDESDIDKIPPSGTPNNKNHIKTSEFCCKNFQILPSFVIDFDCDHMAEGKEPSRKYQLLSKLTREIKNFTKNLIREGFLINQDFFVSFSGSKGFHFQIPHEVIGIEPFEPGNADVANKPLKSLAHILVREFGDDKEFLEKCIDDSIYSKDRIFRTINSFHPKSGLFTYLLDEDDIGETSDIDSIMEKAKDLNIIDVPAINYSKNDKLYLIYCDALKNNINDILPASKSFQVPSHHTDIHFPCKCVEYQAKYGFSRNNRFEDNMVFVICAYNYGGEAAVKNFNRQYAETIKCPDPEKKAEEWTKEIISTLDGRVHRCNTIQDAGKTFLGTFNVINQYIYKSKIPHVKKFECNLGCPFLINNTELPMNERLANRWADRYIEDEKIINFEQTLYKYNGAYYKRVDEDEIKADICNFLGGRFNKMWRENIWLKIQDGSIVKKESFETVEDEICLNNGVLNLKTFEMAPHTKTKLFFNKFDVNYQLEKSVPESPLLDEFINNLFPSPDHSERKDLLFKYVGYMFTPRTEYQVACLMTSDGNSGKSTFANILEGLFGEGNWANVSSINDINDKQLAERYKNKRAIYIDEIGTNELMDDGKLKSIISGGEVNFNSKWKRPGSYKNNAKFLLGTNNQGFLTRDYSNGFCRRFIVVKFPANFSKNKALQVLDIDKKILSDQNARDRLFYIAMEYLKELRKDGEFKMSEKMKNEIYMEIMSNNNVLEFVKNHLFYLKTTDGQQRDSIDRHDIWKYYQEWAKEKGLKPYSDKNFWREIKRHIKCNINEGGPHYKKSNGRVLLKNIDVKGLNFIHSDKSISDKIIGVRIVDIDHFNECLSLADGSYNDYLEFLEKKSKENDMTRDASTDFSVINSNPNLNFENFDAAFRK